MRTPSSRAAVILVFGALLFGGASCANRPQLNSAVASAIKSSRRMPDGKQWTTDNLNLEIADSYCYADAELNCGRYGRLYTWQSAQLVCESLGGNWRLPANDDWHHLASQYGGIRDTSPEPGRAAFKALLIEGSSGFNAVLGGGRAPDSAQYARLDGHGFYWTATETGPSTAWFYNFGRGQASLGRHDDGEKKRAFSVRCVRG